MSRIGGYARTVLPPTPVELRSELFASIDFELEVGDAGACVAAQER
jgi:hypothetical protein